MPYFDCFPFIATREGDIETVTTLKSIRARLARAARALDHMLAALSNPATGKQGPDVVETAAEAFDRELLYLAAAFDSYGRRYPLLIDSTRDPSRFRQSLDGRGYLTDHVDKEYDASVLTDVARLHVYAGVCKVLRNHIHDGILPVDQHPGRSYGNLVNVALNLDVMPELAPGANNGMQQQHFDALGVWTADPAKPWDTPVMVADFATAGFTLMGAGLALVEAFTKLILRNKPKAASAPSPLLGCVQAGPARPSPHRRSVRYSTKPSSGGTQCDEESERSAHSGCCDDMVTKTPAAQGHRGEWETTRQPRRRDTGTGSPDSPPNTCQCPCRYARPLASSLPLRCAPIHRPCEAARTWCR